MKKLLFSVILAISFVWLAGCCEKKSLSRFNAYADLNGDGKPETIFLDPGKFHFTYSDYNLVARFSDQTLQDEPRLIRRFKAEPDQIGFIDLDNDGDLDLVFSDWGTDHFTYKDYNTYLVKNDGSGNFGTSAELIDRRRRLH